MADGFSKRRDGVVGLIGRIVTFESDVTVILLTVPEIATRPPLDAGISGKLTGSTGLVDVLLESIRAFS